MKMASQLSLVVLFLWLLGCEGFVVSRQRLIQSKPSVLFLSDDAQENIDEMRRLIESSWNKSTMGKVPTDAESAADTAIESLNAALASSSSEGSRKSQVFHVDILLPQYDIRQGSNMYDEVLASEFCIHLANRLTGKTEILVKDKKTLMLVNRVLSAREGRQPQMDDDARDDSPSTIQEDDEVYENNKSGIEEFDDFAEIGFVGEVAVKENDVDSQLDGTKPTSTDVNEFRQQLISGWKDEASDNQRQEKKTIVSDDEATPPPSPSSPGQVKSYRLASMLGDAVISSGADGSTHVLKAVAENAIPKEDEETMIILSANSLEENIAVRCLVARYSEKMKIILVNCNFEQTPRELMSAQTVYSIQPFIARPKQSDLNLFKGTDDANANVTPKVVVMRRFPANWEIFVDVADGTGFELAAVIPVRQAGKRGPSSEMIAGYVKSHLQSREMMG